MKTIRSFQIACLAGTFFLAIASTAVAMPITYTTNSPMTEFVGPNGLVLNSTGGHAGTLTFVPNISSTTGVPSNIDLGNFMLACATCTSAQTTIFGNFTFDLMVTDTTDGGAEGIFVGTSSGGTVSVNSSTINIAWSPLQLGPGTLNAASGNFGATSFTKLLSPVTSIVAPNSGGTPGNTTVQAHITSSPEPGTFVLFGTVLVGISLFGRRKHASQ